MIKTGSRDRELIEEVGKCSMHQPHAIVARIQLEPTTFTAIS